jgi:hypothetical protein
MRQKIFAITPNLAAACIALEPPGKPAPDRMDHQSWRVSRGVWAKHWGDNFAAICPDFAPNALLLWITAKNEWATKTG